MKRIYLEWTPISSFGFDTGYFHMYLVLRDEPQTPEEINTLAWRQSGSVIRGGVPGFNPIGVDLVIQSDLLKDSKDAYNSQADIGSREIRDITGSFDAQLVWEILKSYANGIHGAKYDYELPISVSDSKDHVANSNATILSVLNSVGIDVRSLIGDGSLFPGASSYSTLLGSAGSETIAASSALTSGVTILGRDDVNDFITGTKFADRFYGEQNASYSATFDTVSYQTAEKFLKVTIDSSAAPTAQVTVTDDYVDELVGIEKVILSSFDDRTVVKSQAPTWLKEIDAGQNVSSKGDELDLSEFGQSIIFQDNKIQGSNVKFKNFETIRFGATDDVLKSADRGTTVYTATAKTKSISRMGSASPICQPRIGLWSAAYPSLAAFAISGRKVRGRRPISSFIGERTRRGNFSSMRRGGPLTS